MTTTKLLLGVIGMTLMIGGQAWGISSVVVDPDGHPIEAVTIVTDDNHVHTITDTAGAFTLDLTETVTRITFSHIAFAARQLRPSEIGDRVILKPMFIRGSDIVVRAGRAQTGISPVAFENFSKAQIERDYTVGDLPVLLETTPNMYSYSYAGGNLGATEYKIRGFDSKRISVYIDGVPLNDPEDHTTYFVNLPDFAANIEDVQVQRGVGLSMYGDASFGGSVNIATAGSILTRRVALTTGFGGFFADGDYVGDMRKQAVEYCSGLIDGRWSLSARYSKQYSDGYREDSWWDGWAYFVSVSRLDPRMRTTLNLYGGPIKYHMAWYGISREDLENNRRSNPTPWDGPYANQTDNFNQPHYKLHNTYRISDKLTLHNTAFYIRGKGYYEQFKGGRDLDDLAEYGIYKSDLADPTVVDDTLLERVDLVRQKWVTKNQYGWYPRLDWQHERGQATLGGSFYYFDSKHWGQVVWAENLASSIDPLHKYYEYYGKKYHASLFVDEQYRLTDQLVLSGSVQMKYLKYSFDQTAIGAFSDPHSFDLDWLFVSPRLGTTYQINDRINIFASAAISSREPADAMIYDADDPTAAPAVVDNQLGIDAERVFDIELGGNYRSPNASFSANLYWMEFRNEIIPAGGLDDDGQPILGNAGRSAHTGIELSGSYRLHPNFNLSGNLSFSHDRLKEFLVFSDTDTLDYSGNPSAGFPNYLANVICDAQFNPIRSVFRLRAVGRQYIENGGNKDISIDPYLVAALSLSVSLGEPSDLGQLSLSARVDNLFNEKYEATGVEDCGAWYIPGAERNFFTQLKWVFE